VRTIQGLVAGTLQAVPQQNPADLKHAPKIFTETCKIDWSKSTVGIYNLIRGLSPFPAAFIFLDGKLLKIFRAEKELLHHPDQVVMGVPVGHPQTDGKTFLRFATADGWIRVTELQLEGKKKMGVEEFLRGYRVR
jgi:methionyl-tRNA formyltransferase